jgi:hypothetical protein
MYSDAVRKFSESIMVATDKTFFAGRSSPVACEQTKPTIDGLRAGTCGRCSFFSSCGASMTMGDDQCREKQGSAAELWVNLGILQRSRLWQSIEPGRDLHAQRKTISTCCYATQCEMIPAR